MLGCSSIYGPQKGATPEMIQDMDQWLGAYAELAKERFRKQIQSIREQVLPAEWDLHS